MIHEETIAHPIDLNAVREKLASKRGREYWQGLEELAETDSFKEMMHREFPRGASVMESGIERRSFLKYMGASIALAGVTAACSRQPEEHIVPFVKPPVEMKPGTPLFFATAMPLYGYGLGVLAENHTGRPVKVEGNPNHPASLGATDIFAQASILSLYDPDRSTVALRRGAITTWETFTAALDIQINGEKDSSGKKISEGLVDKGGAGIRVLTGTVTSPTLAKQLKDFQTAFPQARWHQYEPVNRDNANAGARMAFGDAVNTVYKFDRADVVLSLEANFFEDGPGRVRYTRDFASRRDAENGAVMNRLYVIESTPTITGASADHYLHIRPSHVETFARAIARKLGIDAPGQEIESESAKKFVEAVAKDLQAHKGASVVLVGDSQPPIVHAIAHAINEVLGNVGKTVTYIDPVAADPIDQTESLRTLVNDMNADLVDTLVVIGVNPVYDAPADLEFSKALQKVNHRIHLGMYQDETSDLCHWHIPEAHYLESWGDIRGYDGTVSLIQPLIAPLYGGKTAIELMAALFGKGGTSYDLVRKHWQNERGTEDFETFWRQSLAKGVVENTVFQPKQCQVRTGVAANPQEPATTTGLEISFRPDPTIGDGRWSNSGWLQELPKPLTKLTWDNAVIVSINTAAQLGLNLFDYADVTLGNATTRGQVWIQPGHPDSVVTLHLGYGRSRAGQVGNGTGFNAYPLRTSKTPWFATGAAIKRVGKGPEFARTELNQIIGTELPIMTEQNRPIARMATLAEFQKNPDIANEGKHAEHGPLPHHEPTLESIFTPLQYEGYAWAMSIDLSKCTGCGVCAIACQAENNIPVVGKAQVIAGRQMHWIRVDRYYKGDPTISEVQVVHQPVPCMQCENAPCEVVCPVAATMHSQEGLNDMVYNRCVGTRYCSNNCPYKVRRFNFLAYSDLKTPTKQMMYNPDVTVRTRGVMEKCTYCVQRINLARIDAKKENRAIKDGEITTACQQACPAGAIMFGNQRDESSRVAAWKKSPRDYALLADLNTRPRTTYLAKLKNENPELEGHA